MPKLIKVTNPQKVLSKLESLIPWLQQNPSRRTKESEFWVRGLPLSVQLKGCTPWKEQICFLNCSLHPFSKIKILFYPSSQASSMCVCLLEVPCSPHFHSHSCTFVKWCSLHNTFSYVVSLHTCNSPKKWILLSFFYKVRSQERLKITVSGPH